MRVVHNAASSVLLACGVVLTFAGLSSALGFTPSGMLASAAAIAVLLYAGGVWLGRPPIPVSAGAATIVVFDRALRVASGPGAGSPVSAAFPDAIRSDIERHCLAALGGEPSHFVCEHGPARFAFDVAPVRNIAGVVLFGVLITGSGALESDVASAAAVRLARHSSAP
jgi:hypothetical protein